MEGRGGGQWGLLDQGSLGKRGTSVGTRPSSARAPTASLVGVITEWPGAHSVCTEDRVWPPRQPTQSSSAGREGPVHTLALAQGLCPVCQGLLFRGLRHVGKFPLSSRDVGLGCPFAWNVLSSSVLIPQNRQVEVEILCQKASALLSRVLRTATWCPEGPGQRECHQQRAKAPLPSLGPQHESQHPGRLQFGE